ncbi:Protein ROH1-like [Dillenia turbinata]|uniref:Protein ROH1-like n=1 Tax=Dillenia turbinata TaxID=194707 RepID=A0AAN8UQ03_9MAGN
MSRTQDPHRPSFPFGNAFRKILPKGSSLPPKPAEALTRFEKKLGDRLWKLVPENKNDIVSLSWMRRAIQSLCETHTDIKDVMSELDFPVSDWDVKWVDVYLDNSVKLLDICIAFSSELSRLNQGHLLLQFVLHNLDASSSKQLMRASTSLDGWRQHISSKNPRVENCLSILYNLIQSLNLPKVKNSAKGKVLMRAMYGVKVQTVCICNMLAAAFCGSAKNLVDLHIDDRGNYLWANAFKELQIRVNTEIRDLFRTGRSSVLKELEAVDTSVKALEPMTRDGVKPEEGNLFQDRIADLGNGAEKLSRGLDLLTKEVDHFFQIVLSGRDALLSNLRVSSTNSEISENKAKGQTLLSF